MGQSWQNGYDCVDAFSPLIADREYKVPCPEKKVGVIKKNQLMKKYE